MTIYKQNIPQANDQISVSQQDLLDNFNYLDNILNREHVQLPRNDANPQVGGHRFMSMVDQSPSIPTIPAGSSGVAYTFANQFFFTNALAQTFQLTGTATAGVNGAYVLPGGIKLVWGQGTTVSTTNPLSVTFPASGFSAVYSLQLTRIGPAGSSPNRSYIRAQNVTNTGFQAFSLSESGSVQSGINLAYFAVGAA